MISEKITLYSELDLPGMLTIPTIGTAPYPCVVLVHGSGASDMDSRIYAIAPFKDIAEGLAALGVASLRYDKRSFVMTGADAKKFMKDGCFTVKEETVDDAIAAVQFAKSDPRIDTNRVFIAGLSLGAMLTPRIDAEGADAAGLIIMSGSPGKLETLSMKQQDDFLSNIKGIKKWIYTKLIHSVRKKYAALETKTDDELKKIPFAGSATMYYLKEMGRKTGGDYLSESAKPVLIMHPEDDLQVPVESFYQYQSILKDRDNVVLIKYPGLNHCFMKSIYKDITKAIKEYKTPQHVQPQVIEDMARWVNNQ